MSALQILLFGKFQARLDCQPLLGFEIKKVQELFCYLLLYRERLHPRETLADILWPDTIQSRKYLRKALWQLQAAFDDQAGLNSEALLVVEPDWIQINPQANLWLDIATFEQAFVQVQGIPGYELDETQADLLKDAVGLYRGDLLEVCYTDWCLYERERFKHMYLAMLDKLIAYCEHTGHHASGIFYGNQAIRYDRARERTNRRLMRLYYLGGYRTEAIRQYDRCVKALKEELNVEPTRRTKTLYRQICADESLSPAPAANKTSSPLAPLGQILAHIQQLQTVLAEARHQIQNDIRDVVDS